MSVNKSRNGKSRCKIGFNIGKLIPPKFHEYFLKAKGENFNQNKRGDWQRQYPQ